MTTGFETIWQQIRALTGEKFFTKRGLEFSFEIQGDTLLPSRTDYKISKSDFRIAYDALPCDGPGELSQRVRGSSYVWAILQDRRVKEHP
jgi:hypothetical protein